jgi:catechol 2,3-dioxygenase-like lactoylglutathione lyase family enzyme
VRAPLAVTHVGVTVTDLDRAVRWYAEVLGFQPLGPPVEVRAEDGHAAVVAADVFGAHFGGFRQAHLAGANGVALELFQFLDPLTERVDQGFDYRKTGIFHVCVVAADVDAVAERIASSGGRRRTARTWQIFPAEPYLTCFCEDPFGIVIELYSHSHERTHANRGTGV